MTKPEDTGATTEDTGAIDQRAAATTAPELVSPAEGLNRREFVASVGATAVAVSVLGARTAEASPAGPAPIYRIHPAIGVARVGNADPSTDGFIVGPEIPGQQATEGLSGAPVTQYKVHGKIKPQAARFRIYEYRDDGHGHLAPVGEIAPQTPTYGTPFVKSITWTAHVANRKASFFKEAGPVGEMLPAGDQRNPQVTGDARKNLESDFGPRTIGGLSQGPITFAPGGSNGSYPETVVQGAGGVVIDYLGQLRTDAQGHLLVFAGRGKAASSLSPAQPLTHWSNNNFWFDDIADGPVTATVTLDDGYGHLTTVPMDAAGNAWCLAAPPDFSPGLQAHVSLYDMLTDLAVRKQSIPANALYYGGPLDRLRQLNQRWDAWEANPVAGGFEFGDFTPDYQSEIWPLILNGVNYVYTTGLVNFKHGNMMTDPLGVPDSVDPGAYKDRGVFFNFMRPPEGAATNSTGQRSMPKMYGDNWYVGNSNFVYDFGQDGPGNGGGGAVQGNGPRSVPPWQRYATVTPTQYGLLRAWNAGNFIPPPGIAETPTAITPHGLDRAALENCIGSPFYPGIECSWQIRNPALFIEPFRLNLAATSQYRMPDGTLEGGPLRAGHFSRQMALPWHCDFNDCSKLLNLAWWPSARPDDVFLHANDALKDRVPWSRPDDRFEGGNTGSGYDDLVAHWHQFGFVLESDAPGFYIEKERADHIP